MNDRRSHRRRLLAERGPVRVERCSCGQIILHVGFVTLTLEKDALSRLIDVLQEASDAERVDLLNLTATLPGVDEPLH